MVAPPPLESDCSETEKLVGGCSPTACSLSSILGLLPDSRHRGCGDEFPVGIIGAKIVKFGQPEEGDFEGGGLAIEFIPDGEIESKIVIFAFTELGMWVARFGPTQASTQV